MRKNVSIGQHRETKRTLKGWKLYAATGMLAFLLFVPLAWLSSLKRHPHAAFESIPEIAVVGGGTAIFIVLSIGLDK